ncbi:MAG: putative oxidoreductase [Alphaproteobacteria bacterium MarineAlpha9_Bin7]|nr:MAG: putative oxidoreductase [Alphaproteobacteria bacterium MarineAlpha9_Bin7]
MKIDGAAAVVTGGASGLGAATSREMARAGAKVAIFDINGDAGERLASELGGLFVHCDVADEPSVSSAFLAANKKNGATRLLVNCAGIAPMARIVRRSGPHELTTFEEVIRVNLTGTFNCARIVANSMAKLDAQKDGDRGVIINTASVAGFDGNVGSVAYAASKAAVAGMTLPLARDLAEHDIRVVAIAPGAFDTPMYGTIERRAASKMLKDVLSPRRMGQPAEFAKLVRHIVENQMLNGEVIRLDAGIRMAASYSD